MQDINTKLDILAPTLHVNDSLEFSGSERDVPLPCDLHLMVAGLALRGNCRQKCKGVVCMCRGDVPCVRAPRVVCMLAASFLLALSHPLK